MSEEIINRVAESKLITFNLEDYYLPGKRVVFDISEWLLEGFLLKEKEFRVHAAEHDWSQYQDAYVALQCSTDAVVPGWAYMLLATKLQPFAKRYTQGSLEQLETLLYAETLKDLDVSEFKDKFVIVKGCSNKPVPPNAYVLIIGKLQPVVKSLMYGEACSSVPLYKRK
ncbi:DUF2480 family protein [Zobellia amurskyensis]|uniref:DUF2480 family protein n=1 Tax=Zobellia amurskyensis TaxID=248905 RepID=A0A7X2ZRI7_9FLAO|nr:DUF2480 family protein [Zobellia amurskyensis]MUH35039.1 DUF2480 family protein [Zobellia amurskyensis]